MENLKREQLTELQEENIEKIKRFFNSGKSVVTVAGPAGSSKTSIISFVIKDLELEKNTAYAAYTGKAASVLRRKGLPATTIHKLIYDANINEMTGEVVFSLKEALPYYITLLVIDEISMVGEKLLKDLLSFGIQIIALGDQYQLEPVKEYSNGLLENPDVVLTEQFRQDTDYYLYEFCTQIRNSGDFYTVKLNSNLVKKIDKDILSMDMLLWADQVLCTTNKTRKILNSTIREYKEFKTGIPEIGDKVICLRNYDNVLDNSCSEALFNGLVGYITQIHRIQRDEFAPFMDVQLRAEYDENLIFNCRIDLCSFLGLAPYKNSKKTKYPFPKTRCLFDFGYCITVHKSQGSEYGKILVYFEPWGDEITRRRLAYTAASRAQDKLVWVL